MQSGYVALSGVVFRCRSLHTAAGIARGMPVFEKNTLALVKLSISKEPLKWLVLLFVDDNDRCTYLLVCVAVRLYRVLLVCLLLHPLHLLSAMVDPLSPMLLPQMSAYNDKDAEKDLEPGSGTLTQDDYAVVKPNPDLQQPPPMGGAGADTARERLADATTTASTPAKRLRLPLRDRRSLLDAARARNNRGFASWIGQGRNIGPRMVEALSPHLPEGQGTPAGKAAVSVLEGGASKAAGLRPTDETNIQAFAEDTYLIDRLASELEALEMENDMLMKKLAAIHALSSSH